MSLSRFNNDDKPSIEVNPTPIVSKNSLRDISFEKSVSRPGLLEPPKIPVSDIWSAKLGACKTSACFGLIAVFSGKGVDITKLELVLGGKVVAISIVGVVGFWVFEIAL